MRRYRVVCAGRGALRVVVVRREGEWLMVERDSYHPTTRPRAAVAHYAWSRGWPVVEIRGPGEATTAEAVAAEREACAVACDAIADAPESRIEEARGADDCATAIRARGTAPTP